MGKKQPKHLKGSAVPPRLTNTPHFGATTTHHFTGEDVAATSARPSKSERAQARKNPAPTPTPPSRTAHFDIGRSGWDSRGNYQGRDPRGPRGWSPGGVWYG